MKDKRTYDKEFKLMAVELMNLGKTSTEVGKDLGIESGLVRRWRRELEKYNEGSFSGKGVQNITPEEQEITKLKKELVSFFTKNLSYLNNPFLLVA